MFYLLKRTLFLFIVIGLESPNLLADSWLEQVGYDRLSARLGWTVVPDCSGVSMTQVEAASSSGGHLPQAGRGDFDGVDAFEGKRFHAHSATSLESGHARIVGHFLYGSEPLLSFGAISLSSTVVEVDLYQAGVREYLGADFLVPSSKRPPFEETNPIQNHSWYGQMGTASVAYMNDKLRRLDYSVSRDDFLCVVSMANGEEQPIPPLIASAFNVLTVGCSHGEHSHGYTDEGLDGGPRMKVDLVAPLAATSFATAAVSSAAAVLMESAASEDARHSEVMRAILMAGASPKPFPEWHGTSILPFDPVFGSGELRVDDSYRILAENQWSYSEGAKPRNEIPLYLNDPLQGVSIVLAWNRHGSFGSGRSRPGMVADMKLQLYYLDSPGGERELVWESDSYTENREQVRAGSLVRGRYMIVVESDVEVPFGLAWNVTLESVISLAVVGDGVSASGLDVGESYVLQRSLDLSEWKDHSSFRAASHVQDIALPQDDVKQAYYRLAW